MFKILIVEDDKELSLLFQKVLEKSGYQVKSASDGAQALEVLDREYIDLIISDIMMPVMDGYELVSELRSAGYQIPVLMITAKSSFDDMRQGFLSGSDDYMVKPVNVNEMVLRVGALLRRAQILNEHKIVIGSTSARCPYRRLLRRWPLGRPGGRGGPGLHPGHQPGHLGRPPGKGARRDP